MMTLQERETIHPKEKDIEEKTYVKNKKTGNVYQGKG